MRPKPELGRRVQSPPPTSPELENIVKKLNKDDDDAGMTAEQWSRWLIVAFMTGLALGMFAIWQYQEIRRRRQARV